MRVTKWGNSLGVRLPKLVVEDLGLRVGDELRVVKTIDGTLLIDIGRRREQAAERPPPRNPAVPGVQVRSRMSVMRSGGTAAVIEAEPKKPRRRRQTDEGPTAHSCQLVTRPAHCRFKRFQRVSKSWLLFTPCAS